MKYNFFFSKLARFLAEGQGGGTMQRCAEPGIYRRSLEHWAIGRRVGEGGAVAVVVVVGGGVKRSVFQSQAQRT